MRLKRIRIRNFRNFRSLDLPIAGDLVLIGENRTGKSNLLFALRLVLDPTLPDSARQLSSTDFWDGLQNAPTSKREIEVSVDIDGFEGDENATAVLTDYRSSEAADVARLTYLFQPRRDLGREAVRDEDYEFLCFGGSDERRPFGHEVRSRLTMELLPALRDAEGELQNWRRSPLRPLIERTVGTVDETVIKSLGERISKATCELAEVDQINSLACQIREAVVEMAGLRQNVDPCFGFAPVDAARLYRSIRLLVDGGLREIGEASLGSTNLVYLALKELQLQHLADEGDRVHTILAVEEPEAHLHPHLQRTLYRHFLSRAAGTESSPRRISLLLTTHSPHIASIAPLRSLALLRRDEEGSSSGCSLADLPFSNEEVEDLERYLDINRADILFARAVVLVEGDAEKFLVPSFARSLGIDLDKEGISVCSVGGVNFEPYVKLLQGLGIRWSVVTDWDPREDDDGGSKRPLGRSRAEGIAAAAAKVGTAVTRIADPDGLSDEEFREEAANRGIFLNDGTLETALARSGFEADIITALDLCSELTRPQRTCVRKWKDNSEHFDPDDALTIIEAVGKGRFARRLAVQVEGRREPPAYIRRALEWVATRHV